MPYRVGEEIQAKKDIMYVHPSTPQLRGEKPHGIELVPQQNISSRLVPGIYLYCIYVYPSRGRYSIFTIKIALVVFMSCVGTSEEHVWLAGRMVRQCDSFQFFQQILLSEQLSCRGLLLCFSDTFAL